MVLFCIMLFALMVVKVTTLTSTVYLDGPHVPLAGADVTSNDPFQWWYFDLITPEGASFQVIFYSGDSFNALPTPYYAEIVSLLPNGTLLSQFLPSSGLGTVTPSVSGYSNGVWSGIGGWTSNEQSYVVTFSNDDGSISGNLTVHADTPSHYPCDESTPPTFATTVSPNLVGPWLGWSNAIPGGSASAFLSVDSQTFGFAGHGYHDSNFGLKSLPQFVDQWYWGRGFAGPYTFVWFAYLPQNTSISTENPDAWYTSGYLAYNGRKVVNFCSNEQSSRAHLEHHISIQTSGAVWTDGPDAAEQSSNATIGVSITYVVDGIDYTFNQTSIAQVIEGVTAGYASWSSQVVGGLRGEDVYDGQGFFEVLAYGP